MSKERKLGRGLDSLLGKEEPESHVQELPVALIVPNPNQPRKDFPEEELQELAASIRSKGVIQPLIVRRQDDGTYDLIAGERRLRASIMAGKDSVPVIVRDYSDQDAAEISLIENLQRENLNPIEEGEAYRYFIETYNYTQEELAVLIGKSRPYVGNMLRVVTFPEMIKKRLRDGQVTVGQVRPLLAVEDEGELDAFIRRILKDHLSAREVEALVRRKKQEGKKRTVKEKGDAHLHKLEEELQLSLGTRVHISNGKGKNKYRGSISITYENETEFQRLVTFLKNEE